MVLSKSGSQTFIAYEAWREYRDKYIDDREIWVGNYILKNFGYDALIIFAQAHDKAETAFHEWFAQVESCAGIEGQCNMFCCKFLNCPYRNEVEIIQ